MMRGFSFTRADYERLYPKVLAADLPPFAKQDWTLAFAVRLDDWRRAEQSARGLAALMPGSYYGDFWTGYALLKQGKVAEARDALRAASESPAISPCAQFIVSVYLAKALGEVGDMEGRTMARARAAAIFATHRYTDGLAAKLGHYIPDGDLMAAVEELSRANGLNK
jgi:predicted Zn-dependent protease